MTEPLPCPFCGGDAAVRGDSRDGFYVACSTIDCLVCLGERYDRDAMPDHCFRTEEDAIAAWNKRAPTHGAGWRPMETAPTDGTRVLCAFCKGETPEVLYFSDGIWYSELEREGQTSFIFQPTRWMPLPEPPGA